MYLSIDAQGGTCFNSCSYERSAEEDIADDFSFKWLLKCLILVQVQFFGWILMVFSTGTIFLYYIQF